MLKVKGGRKLTLKFLYNNSVFGEITESRYSGNEINWKAIRNINKNRGQAGILTNDIFPSKTDFEEKINKRRKLIPSISDRGRFVIPP